MLTNILFPVIVIFSHHENVFVFILIEQNTKHVDKDGSLRQ